MSEHTRELGEHATRLTHLEKGQEDIKEKVDTIDLKLDQVLEALAERRGERQGLKMAVAGWSVLAGAAFKFVDWMVTHQVDGRP